jgi:hypothetical protein
MLAITLNSICTNCHDTVETEAAEHCGYCKPKEPPMQKPIDIANTPVKQLATITARGAVALLLPVLLFSALAGLAAGVAVRSFQLTINLF